MDVHQRQKDFLGQEIKQGRLAQAYLFVGEPGVGKESFTNWLTEQIKKQVDDPWLFQVLRIQPEYPEGGGRGSIKVSQIKYAKRRTELKLSGNNRQIIIIHQAQMMNSVAQDALLKVLEEPKNQTTFILLADFLEPLRSTIQSRCQIVHFNPLTIFQSIHWLIGQGLNPNKANEIAFYGQGRLDLMMELKDNPTALQEKLEDWKNLDRIWKLPLADRFNFAEKMSRERESLSGLLENWLRYWRSVMLIKALDLEVEIGGQTKYDWPQIADQIELIEEVEARLRSVSLNKRLALEQVLI